MSLPSLVGFKRWFACAPTSAVCPSPRSIAASALRQLCVWPPRCSMEPPSAQSPFAQCRYYPPLGRRIHRLLRGHCSSVIAPTDSFANPIWLFFSFGLSLVQEVFAGCLQPLLPLGSSRRYLCESFLGCLVPYHGGPTECVYLFLPPYHRPSPREVWVGFPLLSANTTSRGGCFRGCRHFLYVQASEFACLPGRSYRCSKCRRAAETFTSGQNALRCLRTHRIC